jgi:hypothetical protein
MITSLQLFRSIFVVTAIVATVKQFVAISSRKKEKVNSRGRRMRQRKGDKGGKG